MAGQGAGLSRTTDSKSWRGWVWPVLNHFAFLGHDDPRVANFYPLRVSLPALAVSLLNEGLCFSTLSSLVRKSAGSDFYVCIRKVKAVGRFHDSNMGLKDELVLANDPSEEVKLSFSGLDWTNSNLIYLCDVKCFNFICKMHCDIEIAETMLASCKGQYKQSFTFSNVCW